MTPSQGQKIPRGKGEHPAGMSRNWPKKLLAIAFLLMAFLGVGAVQLWLYSSGKMLHIDITSEPRYSFFYWDLANSFRDGRVSLSIPPRPELMALSDPYDSAVDPQWRLYDMSYYKGHYYMYFGPLPALTILLLRQGGVNLQMDSPLTLLYSWTLMVFFTLALRSLWARLFPGHSLWLATLVGLSSGLSPPITHCLERPSFYEAAILSGQCLFWLSFWLYWSGFCSHPRLAWLRWLAVGTAQVLALAGRVALLPGLFLSGFWMVCRACPLSKKALFILIPWVSGLAGLACYNYARFEDPFNFGFGYQLATVRNSNPDVLSWKHIVPNAYLHLLRPPSACRVFPYLQAVDSELPESIPRAESYSVMQPVVGMLWWMPLIGFVPVGLWSLRRKEERDLLGPLVVTLVSALPALTVWNPAFRYQVDFSLVLMALGLVGAYQGMARWPKTISTLVLLACFYTTLVGVLLGLRGQFDNFERINPVLFRSMQEALTLGPVPDPTPIPED